MTLISSGTEVGLAWGEMGNSEVGHLNIGAGRVYYQSYPRITQEIKSEAFFTNKIFLEAAQHIKKNESSLHIIGIVSPGNVHGSEEHIWALLQFAKKQKIKGVFVHAILDGRDTGRDTAATFVARLQEKIKKIGVGQIASICGRYFAMDRDQRWDRIEKAYRAIVEAKAENQTDDPIAAIKTSYEKQIFDEEFPPTVVLKKDGQTGKFSNGDAAIFTNFRADRARELASAIILPSFAKFNRPPLNNLLLVTMTEYSKDIPALVAYPPVVVKNCLAELISQAGLKQLHIAETEKYAHVTFFLNGMLEEPFPGEDRKIIPSPKVASYAEKPEMSAPEIAKTTIDAIKSDKYDFIVVNFANADMVGHTGDFNATKKGIETIDKAIGKIADHVLAKNGVLIITADHGNAENKINLQTGAVDKEHTTNPVPFIVIGAAYEGQTGGTKDAPEGDLSLLQPVGMLADVAPTILSIIGMPQPEEMTGRTLI
jgi:2,3-bisphosphoglycerate-independent phosphoglycerate mutase